jgi:predicted NUDIX family NTP pyrophosphohydrolase
VIGEGEDPFDAARREFNEETGLIAEGPARALTPLRQPSGKTVLIWAVEGDCDASGLCSNVFSMEWPPRSGKFEDFPEIDRAGWFTLAEAREKILKGQAAFLQELETLLNN